ncbi:MAG: hypothetical protein PV344_07065, partial [Anaplasma sp.]|nr:hypothetical protein [Anaplasma sp.]
ALLGPVRIAFSFASHAFESHNDPVLMTQHSSLPSRASVPCVTWSVACVARNRRVVGSNPG